MTKDDRYVPSGQTMAALGWVPEEGEPGFEALQAPLLPPELLDQAALAGRRLLPRQELEQQLTTALARLLAVQALVIDSLHPRHGPGGCGMYAGQLQPLLSGIPELSPQAEEEGRRILAYGLHPGHEPHSSWKIWPNHLMSPKNEVLFLADLRKLLATIDAHLVSDLQHGADRDQVLGSFTDDELHQELRQRQEPRPSPDCGACRDTGRWSTGIACPVCPAGLKESS